MTVNHIGFHVYTYRYNANNKYHCRIRKFGSNYIVIRRDFFQFTIHCEIHFGYKQGFIIVVYILDTHKYQNSKESKSRLDLGCSVLFMTTNKMISSRISMYFSHVISKSFMTFCSQVSLTRCSVGKFIQYQKYHKMK
jgi:hypothetical protein